MLLSFNLLKHQKDSFGQALGSLGLSLAKKAAFPSNSHCPRLNAKDAAFRSNLPNTGLLLSFDNTFYKIHNVF